jgi:hypothetical protein
MICPGAVALTSKSRLNPAPSIGVRHSVGQYCMVQHMHGHTARRSLSDSVLKINVIYTGASMRE